VNIKKKKNCKV